MNWKHAANYVAKQYIDKVARDVYFDDVKLQMDAKLWGEEYNRYNPPKKVCYKMNYVMLLENLLLFLPHHQWPSQADNHSLRPVYLTNAINS